MRQPEPPALRRLVDEHYAHAVPLCLSPAGSPDETADLTQETFCKAQSRFGQLRDAERQPWLYSITRNERIGSRQSPPLYLAGACGTVDDETPDTLPRSNPPSPSGRTTARRIPRP